MSEGGSLYFGNLDARVTKRMLYEIGVQAGPVARVNLVANGTQNYGFVEYSDAESCEYALKLLDGQLRLFGKQVKVAASNSNRSKSQPARTALSTREAAALAAVTPPSSSRRESSAGWTTRRDEHYQQTRPQSPLPPLPPDPPPLLPPGAYQHEQHTPPLAFGYSPHERQPLHVGPNGTMHNTFTSPQLVQPYDPYQQQQQQPQQLHQQLSTAHQQLYVGHQQMQQPHAQQQAYTPQHHEQQHVPHMPPW